MAKEQLQGLVSDVLRLLIAGGMASAGNEGMRRRAAALRELGNQIAALIPLAEAADRVSQATPDQSTAALLNLLVLANAVKASLTTTSHGETLEPLAESGPWTSETLAGDLYPIAEAIPKPDWHNREVLVLAAKNGSVADLRLVPVLLEAFQKGPDEVAEFVVAQALPSFGPHLVPLLWASLPLHGRRNASWQLLFLCRHQPEGGVELCLKSLQSTDLMLRQAAVTALGQIPLAGRRIVPKLVAMLLEKDKNGRAIYAEALGSLGEEAKEAVPALCQALADEKVPVRIAAAQALTRIRTVEGAAALEAAMKREKEGDVRRAFTAALESLRRGRRR